MTSDQLPSFRTKTGLCIISAEHITLTRNGFRGGLAKFVIGNSMRFLLIRYLLVVFLFLGFGTYLLWRQQVFYAVLLFVVGSMFLLIVVRSYSYSATPLIPRAHIQTITATKPKPPTTRGYFIVTFLEGSHMVKRLIILPSALQEGEFEFQKALAAFQSCGLKVTENFNRR